MNPQDVANLVIEKKLDDRTVFGDFLNATDGKAVDFLSAVLKSIPQAPSKEDAPGALQLSAQMVLVTKMAKLMASEIAGATPDTYPEIVRRSIRLFPENWMCAAFSRTVEGEIAKMTDPGLTYYVLGLIAMGEFALESIPE